MAAAVPAAASDVGRRTRGGPGGRRHASRRLAAAILFYGITGFAVYGYLLNNRYFSFQT
jgi:hypothetical protein